MADALAARLGTARGESHAPAEGSTAPSGASRLAAPLRVTNATMMALFNCESLVRAYVRASLKGTCDPATTIQHGLLRWAACQGVRLRADVAKTEDWPDGWLANRPEVRIARSGGESTTVAVKRIGELGDDDRNDSDDAEALMRAAPIGLFARPRAAFELASIASRRTHASVQAYLPAACFAEIISRVVAGQSLKTAWGMVLGRVERLANATETVDALHRAASMVDSDDEEGDAAAFARMRMRPARSANDVLAVAIYAAESSRDFENAVHFAADDAGIGGAVVTGQLRGAIHGVGIIPKALLDALELREVAEQIAIDLAAARFNRLEPLAASARYPGW